MSKMKDSRIQWIGNIPEEWKKIKIKNVCQKVFAGGTPSTDIEEYWNGNIPWLPSGACHDKYIENANIFITEKGFRSSSTKLIPANTTLIAMTGATCGNTGYLTFDSCANQSVTAYINDKKELNSLYLFYALQAAREYILTYQTGGAQAGINVDNCKNFIIPISNIKEQKLIADFLDEKVNIIDNIICDLDNQIEILGKYKKQLISEIVTRGLNKKEAMKDSGIEWIGSIPEHWKIKRMKYICKKITDGSHFSPETQLSGKKYITVSDVYNDKIHIENAKFITEDDFKLLVKNGCRPSINDVLLSKDGTVGRSAIVDTNDFVVLSSLGILTPSNLMYGKYLKYMLDSEMLQEQMKMSTDGSALKRITISKISNFIGIIPSLAEQMEIVNYLDKKCSEIEEILNSKIKQKEQMEQYKKSVIYEYVTGKKRVEGAEELYG